METTFQSSTTVSDKPLPPNDGPKPLYTLEIRTCKCGCQKTWKALPSSLNQYWSLWHEKGLVPNIAFDFDPENPRLDFSSPTAKRAHHLYVVRTIDSDSLSSINPIQPDDQ